MTSHARRTDGNQKAIVQALRDAGHKVYVTSDRGSGIPDLIVITRKMHIRFWMECKMPGEWLSPAEKELFPVLPGEYRIAHSIEEALNWAEDAGWMEDDE